MIADQFNSYPDQWKTVITCARQKFRAYLAGQDAFPDTQSGLDEVERYLVDALPTHLEGGAVEPSKPGSHRKHPSSTMLSQNTTSMKP